MDTFTVISIDPVSQTAVVQFSFMKEPETLHGLPMNDKAALLEIVRAYGKSVKAIMLNKVASDEVKNLIGKTQDMV